MNADQSISLEPVQYSASHNRFESFRDQAARICYSVYFNWDCSATNCSLLKMHQTYQKDITQVCYVSFSVRKAKIDCGFCFKTAVAMVSSNLWWVVGAITSCQYPCTREASVSVRNAGSSKVNFIYKCDANKTSHVFPFIYPLPLHMLGPKKIVWKHVWGSTCYYFYLATKEACYITVL